MKSLLRSYLFHLAALYAVDVVLEESFSITGEWYNYFLAALVFTILNIILKPILRLLFFPITALTLGLFSLVINGAVFYLFLQLVPNISFLPWTFPGFSFYNFTVPSLELNLLGTIVAASLIVALITNFLAFLVK